jgi:hypothetical protein
MREKVRAERVENRRHRGRFAAARQAARQQPGAERRCGEREDERRVVRDVWISRGQPPGNRDNAADKVDLGVGESPLMGVEDVRVEEVQRIARERVSDPCHVPDGVLAIARSRAAEPPESGDERPGHHRGERERGAAGRRGDDEAPRDGVRACAHVECPLF